MWQTLLILAYSAFDFQDSDKKQVKGVKVHYLIPGTEDDSKDAYTKGLQPMESTIMDHSLLKKMEAVPGVYQAGFQMRAGKKGPEMKLADVSFLGSCDLTMIVGEIAPDTKK